MTDAARLQFRDPARGAALAEALALRTRALGRSPVTVMHVCGSHEQAIARFGLRAVLPPELALVMGPGCPVCVTDVPEVDEAVALAEQGVRIATYGDMLRVPGSSRSLADARAAGARVDVVYGAAQAVELARASDEPVVFFASGFETTAVATAAVLLAGPPAQFSVLSAHKYIPPAMEIVADIPGSRIEGFLAAGHAAAITGWGVFEGFAARRRMPVVIAGFEPLDILAALVRVVELIAAGEPCVDNMFPRCVTRAGNRAAQDRLWQVFEPCAGRWRGIADVSRGGLRLRAAYARWDARERFAIATPAAEPAPRAACRCGDILAGLASPAECPQFGHPCTPDAPVGACMVSAEGTCRIWHQYGGRPDLRQIGRPA